MVNEAVEAVSVLGDWGKFAFRLIEVQDHPKVLKHLRDCLYYPAFFRIGYTKEMDDEWEVLFQQVLNDGYNMHFLVEEKATGKIAGCRVITMEKRGHKAHFPLTDRISKGLLTFYTGILETCNVLDRYKVDECPHMFGVSVEPEFAQQGLATEIYRRAVALLKSRGFSVAIVGFISPYSRAAAMHHGFIQLGSRSLLDATDEQGNTLYPEADPDNFMNVGVFELH